MLPGKVRFISKIRYYLLNLLYASDRLRYLNILAFRRRRDRRKLVKAIYVKHIGSWLIVPSTHINMYLKGHEAKVIKTIKRLIKPGNVFADVGAFVGLYTILAAKLNAKVIAFEPDPRAYLILSYNTMLNNVRDKVTLINKAVGSKEGFASFKLAVSPAWSSMSDYLKKELIIGVTNVPVITLDKVFENLKQQGYSRIDVIKIDVEGAGFEVIKGALNVIKECGQHIILEVHENRLKSELQAINFLKRKFGYTYKILEFRSKRNFIVHLFPK